MRKVFTGIIALCLSFQAAIPALAISQSSTVHLLIVELQTSSQQSSSEKFIEVYNPGTQSADVTGWQIQYRSAASTADSAWKTKATVACQTQSAGCKVSLPAQGWLLFSSYDTPPQQLTVNGAFAMTGGQVRLVQPGVTQTVHDVLLYGDAAAADPNFAADAPGKGKSIKRKVDAGGTFVNTGNSADDFAIACDAPTPGQEPAVLTPTPAICPGAADPAPQTANTSPSAPAEPARGQDQIYLPLRITELLPNPASLQQDSSDEFIELFNPNDQPVDLAGYRLQSGASFRYKYDLPTVVLAPGDYIAIYSADSHLALSNSGTTVQLLDPDGSVIDQVRDYGTAKDGLSWMVTPQGTWQWSTTPTPGAVNALAEPAAAAGKVLGAKTTAAKKTAATAAKPKTAAATKAAVKASALSTAATDAKASGASAANPNYWLLGGFGALVTGYGVYEYRKELLQSVGRLGQLFSGKKQQ